MRGVVVPVKEGDSLACRPRVKRGNVISRETEDTRPDRHAGDVP